MEDRVLESEPPLRHDDIVPFQFLRGMHGTDEKQWSISVACGCGGNVCVFFSRNMTCEITDVGSHAFVCRRPVVENRVPAKMAVHHKRPAAYVPGELARRVKEGRGERVGVGAIIVLTRLVHHFRGF